MKSFVVMGVAGCGKSSLGVNLSQALGVPLIEGDDFHSEANKAKMRQGTPLTDADRRGWLATLSAELARHPQGAVLTCSALKQSYRDQLRQGTQGLRFVFLDLDEPTARARVAARPAHLFPPTLVASQFATLESPVGEPGVLRLDATLPPQELLVQSLAWITTSAGTVVSKAWPHRIAELAMALTLAVMAAAVFVNVVLRYGFGSGIAASEELSRLLFVWMVFIGATAAYPLGEHMAFTSLLRPLRRRQSRWPLMWATRLIHALVVVACGLVGWGAWQQVVVGMDSRSVVLGYPAALLPLPAFLSAAAIGLMALANLLRGREIDLGHGAEVE